MSKLRKEPFERLLKDDMYCWRCERTLKNMPEVKKHMEEEHSQEIERYKKAAANKVKVLKATSKRPREEQATSEPDPDQDSGSPPAKRRETETDIPPEGEVKDARQ